MPSVTDETLDSITTDASGSEPLSDEEINEKYAKGDVRIVTEQARYPLTAIVGMVESGDYELNPDFQRRRRWDNKKQSRLVESFIMNVPIPPIFLYEDSYSHYEVMDGLQRLTAIYEFYKNRLKLEGLVEWKDLNGRRYQELPELVKRGIDRRYLSSIILMQETAKDKEEAQRLKQMVFERINSGGVKLEPQESRNALYNGPLNRLCMNLARNPYLCKTWGIPEPTVEEINGGKVAEDLVDNETYQKMEDVELVLRFFAYRDSLHPPKRALKDYLDKYLKNGNNFPTNELENFKEVFTKTIKLVYDTFGEKAFWQWRNRFGTWDWLRRPALVIYDPLMYTFSKHLSDLEVIIQHREEFNTNIIAMYECNYDSFEGRNTNLSNILERNRLFESLVTNIIGSGHES